MPSYNNSPFVPVPALVSLKPGYAFGSFNDLVPNTRMGITSSAVSSNEVTLGVVVVEGNIPAVGSLIWVQGASVSAVNVVGVALDSVTITTTGVGFVTFAATTANYTVVADQGSAIVKTPEIVDILAVGKSQQFAVPPQTSNTLNTGREVTWAYECPDAPATIAIQLEGAINDVDAEYAIIGSSQTTAAGGTVAVTVPNAYRFLRLNVTAATAGSGSPPSGTIIAKILI